MARLAEKRARPRLKSDGEIVALVIDHQRLQLALGDQIEGLAQELEAVGIDAVHFAVEFEAGDAIPDIPEAGRAIGGQCLARALDVGQQQHAGGTLDRMIAAVEAELLEAALALAIEAAGFGRLGDHWAKGSRCGR